MFVCVSVCMHDCKVYKRCGCCGKRKREKSHIYEDEDDEEMRRCSMGEEEGDEALLLLLLFLGAHMSGKRFLGNSTTIRFLRAFS